jgi:hypothetical protein
MILNPKYHPVMLRSVFCDEASLTLPQAGLDTPISFAITSYPSHLKHPERRLALFASRSRPTGPLWGESGLRAQCHSHNLPPLHYQALRAQARALRAEVEEAVYTHDARTATSHIKHPPVVWGPVGERRLAPFASRSRRSGLRTFTPPSTTSCNSTYIRLRHPSPPSKYPLRVPSCPSWKSLSQPLLKKPYPPLQPLRHLQIRLNLIKPKRLIQPLRPLHKPQRIQPHHLIPNHARLS